MAGWLQYNIKSLSTQIKIPQSKIVSLSTEGQIKALFSSLFDYFFISYEGEAKNDLYRDTKVDT